MPTDKPPALVGRSIRKTYRRDTGEIVQALDDVSLEAGAGQLTAMVGPDGAGKTTLIRLAAGLLDLDDGQLLVLNTDVTANPQPVQDRIGYMPQKFGLYEDLTVLENLNLYADLHGIHHEERRQRYQQLMAMTALGPFTKRLAGRLSGGMKQKLGLACTLVSSPELLLLDEPTVGVDPLSRRELWEIIFHLVREQGLAVLVSTSYLDEAERCDQVVVLHQGKLLAEGPPKTVTEKADGRTFLAEPAPGQKARLLQAHLLDNPAVTDAVPEAGKVRVVMKQASTLTRSASEEHVANNLARASGWGAGFDNIVAADPRFEDGFMVLFKQMITERLNGLPAESPDPPATESATAAPLSAEEPDRSDADEPVVAVHDLVRRFGSFVAVDHISFEVGRGEVFGLLGPNGAGKTTTFRMLCGLLPATSGTLRVAGVDLRTARASARQRIGYVAQKFSLYGQLSVRENLDFFASAYGLWGGNRRRRVSWALTEFELTSFANMPSGKLPGGYKQRLAMAAALLHEPEILFLDEPTSGADPLARREFWRRITALAERGVTVIVTTHFMEEAEYCDRVVILAAGQVLAQGTPAEVRRLARPVSGHAPTMEDAFIAVVEAGRQRSGEAVAG
jgi:ABC-2 type transport system ATP-binding protein